MWIKIYGAHSNQYIYRSWHLLKESLDSLPTNRVLRPSRQSSNIIMKRGRLKINWKVKFYPGGCDAKINHCTMSAKNGVFRNCTSICDKQLAKNGTKNTEWKRLLPNTSETNGKAFKTVHHSWPFHSFHRSILQKNADLAVKVRDLRRMMYADLHDKKGWHRTDEAAYIVPINYLRSKLVRAKI